MTSIPRSRFALFVRAAAPMASLLCAAALLLHFPPARYNIYPQCPIYHYFGILCPGCGTTRALAALLHGRVNEALRFNALTVLLLPAAIGYAVASYARLLTHKSFQWPQPRQSAIYTTLAAAIVFTVVRNL
jgi:hypothetical protein